MNGDLVVVVGGEEREGALRLLISSTRTKRPYNHLCFMILCLVRKEKERKEKENDFVPSSTQIAAVEEYEPSSTPVPNIRESLLAVDTEALTNSSIAAHLSEQEALVAQDEPASPSHPLPPSGPPPSRRRPRKLPTIPMARSSDTMSGATE